MRADIDYDKNEIVETDKIYYCCTGMFVTTISIDAGVVVSKVSLLFSMLTPSSYVCVQHVVRFHKRFYLKELWAHHHVDGAPPGLRVSLQLSF